MVFRVFIFIFLFPTKDKKEHLDENDFHHAYGDYFENAILKVTWYQLCLKFFLSNYETGWQKHLKDTLQLKILRTWINICANSFLDKKMGKGACLEHTPNCTKTWACSLSNISLFFVFFLFPSFKPSSQYESSVQRIIFAPFSLPFYLLLFCVSWSSSSASIHFFKSQ